MSSLVLRKSTSKRELTRRRLQPVYSGCVVGNTYTIPISGSPGPAKAESRVGDEMPVIQARSLSMAGHSLGTV